MRSAYTLLEMVITLSLLVVLAAIAWPIVSSWQQGAPLERAEDELRGVLVGARLRAMDEGKMYGVTFQCGTGSFSVASDADTQATEPAPATAPPANEAGTATATVRSSQSMLTFDDRSFVGAHTLPSELKFRRPGGGGPAAPTGRGAALTGSSANAGQSDNVFISFHPDGTATDTVLQVVDSNGQTLTLTVYGVTGTIETKRGGR